MLNLSGRLTSTPTHHRKIKLRSKKIKASIKRRSEATHDTPQQILEAALQNISKTAAVKLLQINNLKLTIHSQRKDNGLPPTIYVEKIFLCCQKVPGKQRLENNV